MTRLALLLERNLHAHERRGGRAALQRDASDQIRVHVQVVVAVVARDRVPERGETSTCTTTCSSSSAAPPTSLLL